MSQTDELIKKLNHIRPQLAEDIANSCDIDENGWLEDDYFWFDEAYDLKRKIIIFNGSLSIDEVMVDLQYFYKPDTIVRDEMFEIIHDTMCRYYGHYWEHPLSPWTPA